MTRPLTEKQRHCLVALLELDEELRERNREFGRPAAMYTLYAGRVAAKLGYVRGPRQHGNGAKDGRSFSGYGALGKYVTGALQGLAKRGLIYRRYADLGGYRDRVLSNYLTTDGKALAEQLRADGVRAQMVQARADKWGETEHVPA